MRTIGAVTVGRSDYSICLPVLREIQQNPDLHLHLIVAGTHLAPEFGMTVRLIEEDGFEIGERIEMSLSSDTPEAISKSMGLGMIGFAQAFARCRPDILMIVGDRFEAHAAVAAALAFKIAVAHIHGGEITLGAIDDALRHSITKLSHLHFVATEAYGLRVLQLGEEPWRITVCGAPSLDNLLTVSLLTTEQIESLYGVRMEQAPLLVTFHPVTLEYEQTEWQVGELLAALEATGLPTVFTSPNADTCGKTVARMISDYVRVRSTASLVQNLGTQGYLSMMALAAAMVGNSSSGIVEAASLRVPVVNVGTRQSGRIRPANVIDTGYGREEIGEAIRQALRPEFRARLANLVNPYGCGHAARKIADRLRDVSLDSKLIMKRFYDVPLAKVN